MKKLGLILGMTLMASLAYAQEDTSAAASSNTSTVEKSQVVPKDAQSKDIDEELTNARMRAATGSKSKYSFRSSFGFSGGSIEQPFSKERPNYRASDNDIAETELDGSIGMKFRATERDSISLSIGVSVATPLHNSASELGEKTNISDPSLGYDRIYKVGDVQMVTSAGASVTTDRRYIDAYNIRGGWAVSQTAIYSTDIGWDMGATLSFGETIYGDSDMDKRSAYSLGLYPFAEYSFNDTVQFRTVFGYFNYGSRREAPTTLAEKVPYQSMGLGFVLTRDIYVYPNVQFVPTDIRADRTNVAVGLNLSL